MVWYLSHHFVTSFCHVILSHILSRHFVILPVILPVILLHLSSSNQDKDFLYK